MKAVEFMERVPSCVAIEWIDSRDGSVIERHSLTSAPQVEDGLETMTSIVTSQDRPRRAVLLSQDYLFIAHRAAPDSYRVLVAICARTPNIGFSIAAVRVFATDVEPDA